ncbi:hypothetical protein [Burkholderia anthina]|uniref:hypothetical protein n=1 Tax=Burkholderia anthina TaxID=179879 RepID=UPI00158D0C38|nr:hypothetical protein [Burkholderia anthina]
MKIANTEGAGPIRGVTAGLVLAAVGLAMGVTPKLLQSTGTLSDFVASVVQKVAPWRSSEWRFERLWHARQCDNPFSYCGKTTIASPADRARPGWPI